MINLSINSIFLPFISSFQNDQNTANGMFKCHDIIQYLSGDQENVTITIHKKKGRWEIYNYKKKLTSETTDERTKTNYRRGNALERSVENKINTTGT